MQEKKNKSKTKLLIVVAAIVLAAAAVAAFLLLRPKTGDGYRIIVVAEVSGSVLVSNDKKQDVAAYVGMALFDGDTITVSEGAALTIELDGDKYMMAEAGTKFRLEATGKAGSDKTVIHLESGAALTRIKNALNEDQSYVIKTPNSVISVLGTVWRTSFSQNAERGPITLCEVFGGLVEMTAAGSAGEPRQIPGGSSACVIESQGSSEPEDLDYSRLPKGIIEILLSFLDDREELDASKEELESYLHEHTWSAWEADGDNHIRSCECEKTQSEAHVWNEGVVTTQPTHLKEGEKTFTCSVCEHTKTEMIEKLTEHTWSAWKADGDNHSCSCECGERQTEAHAWNEGVVTTQPSHLAEGEKTFTCTVCEHTKTEMIAKLTEHTWSAWEVDGDNHSRFCECEKTQSEAHAWNDGVVTTQPSHLEEGEKTFTCSICEHTKTEMIAKLTEHTWSAWKADGDNHSCSCECGESQTEAHSFDDGVEGTDPSGAEAMVYTCVGCQYQKYEIIQPPVGQFAVENTGYETWYEAAMALSNSSSRTVYLLRDLWSYDFSYIFGAVSLPYDNTDIFGADVPAFYDMTWDLNGYGFRLFGDEKAPPRIYAGAAWTIQATGGGMLSTDGYGLYCPWYGGLLEGEIVILGGMFDFDPTEYVPAGYTVRMVLAPDFYQGTDASAAAADYAAILAQYGTYSAILNDRDKDEAELYHCRTPGLWIVYPDGAEPSCEHDCFTVPVMVDGVGYDYCSGCGERVAHRHSVNWLRNPDEHAQECATCYETLVEWENHTFDEGVAGVNDFGENGTIYTCKVCDYREMRLTCTGEHIYGAGVQGTAAMVYTCIYCDHQVTMENLHECDYDWPNPVYNDNYHWYPCTTTGCPARLDYGVHSYEPGTITWPTHDQPGVMADTCYCGYVCPGSEVPLEFSSYFLDFSGCTAEGISQYDNTIYAGAAFDYENIRLIGYYEDTTLEWDENYNITGYDYGRVLDPGEYTVYVYRIYSYDQKLLLSELDLTVPGEYQILYLTPDGYGAEVSVTILANAG